MDICTRKTALALAAAWVVALPAALAEPDKGKEEDEAEMERKEHMEARLAEEKEVKSQFGYTFNDIGDCIVTISCASEHARSSGSGFVARMDGRPYLFTNQHVILGADRITFKTTSGQTLKPLGVELSATRDIARLPLGPVCPALEISGKMSMGAPIGVFGNSEGGGVATELYGKVTGISSDKLEVSADFVGGNSGSPVLNLDRKAIGIASFVRWKTNDDAGEETRRFCYRLTGDRWGAVNWKKYNDAYGKQYRETEELLNSIFDIINLWYSNPSSRISASSTTQASLRRWTEEHNGMVDKIEKMLDKGEATQKELDSINRKIRNDLIDSADELSRICTDRARALRMIAAKQRDMTGFLHGEFTNFAERLDNMSVYVAGYGKWLEDYNYFRFKDK
jgi:hypothetical protein